MAREVDEHSPQTRHEIGLHQVSVLCAQLKLAIILESDRIIPDVAARHTSQQANDAHRFLAAAIGDLNETIARNLVLLIETRPDPCDSQVHLVTRQFTVTNTNDAKIPKLPNHVSFTFISLSLLFTRIAQQVVVVVIAVLRKRLESLDATFATVIAVYHMVDRPQAPKVIFEQGMVMAASEHQR